VSDQFHSPVAFRRGNNSRYPLDRRLGGPQSRSGQHGEEKILAPTGTRTPTPRLFSRYPVDILTALSRLPESYKEIKKDLLPLPGFKPMSSSPKLSHCSDRAASVPLGSNHTLANDLFNGLVFVIFSVPSFKCRHNVSIKSFQSPSRSLPIHYSLSILLLNAIQSEPQTVSLNKNYINTFFMEM
jgi:hypothetical protein